MGAARDAAPRGEEADRPVSPRLISDQVRAAGAAADKRGAAGRKMRVEEFPGEALETVDRLLADEELHYRSISEALAARGFSIKPGDIGRYAARKADEARREKALSRQLDELERWIGKHPGFDLAGAALTMAISGFSKRLASDEAPFENLPADKAAAGLIQAARAIDQHEKIAGDRKKKAAAARQAVILELREALKKRPELREEIERLIG